MSPEHNASPVPFVVAVDGPAGSGKSSVSKAAAAKLGFAFLDTGAAYRALTWFATQRGIDVAEADAVVASIADFDYRIDTEPGRLRVFVGETDVTTEIRNPEVSARVSAVARIPEVRLRLNELFRGILSGTDHDGIVAEGRDITTVVAPEAPARILLTASPEVRAARRAGELDGHSAADVAAQLHARDRADLQVVDFMSAAEGVTTVDSTDLNFDETVDAVIDVIKSARASGTGAAPSRGGTDV
ncbi:(d)CMP kinase [Planctomonas sp. JC2975]|uniref:(d)CMP kinase n=1 Tax=Planctomonas sp. JC2975 TaxID=2729626 RepID=UPI001472B8ED|nr:(d)CMP kinase [Planctomonas sp. JC2975]NNC10289.1 (d)CMP kinase [Planctomonas sp. JC2975]